MWTAGKVMQHLREAGIQSSIHYPPVHRFTYYRNCFRIFRFRNGAFLSRELTLPLHPGLSESDVERVVDALKEAI